MVAMLLTGTFVRTLDEKHRLSVPRSLRQALDSTVFYLTPGTDGSLTLFPEGSFAEIAEQLARGSATGPDIRAFSRLFYAQARRLDMDRHGRLRIPSELAELAGFGKEIVLLGVRDHLELWDRQRWNGYLAQEQLRYDEIADLAFDGPRRPNEETRKDVGDGVPQQPR